jgi:hypothetical protein
MIKPDIEALGVQERVFIVLPRQWDRLETGGVTPKTLAGR